MYVKMSKYEVRHLEGTNADYTFKIEKLCLGSRLKRFPVVLTKYHSEMLFQGLVYMRKLRNYVCVSNSLQS